MKYPRVLSIAGSDSGGGAGIQADIKTISAAGVYSATAITAITAQNTCGVIAIHPIPVDIIEAQIEAVLSDIGADCIKIGMLHSAKVIRMVCAMLDKYEPRNVVLDPVMVSTSGHRLIEAEAIDLLREELLPRASIVTPNIPEAEVLLSRKLLLGASQSQAEQLSSIEQAAKEIGHLGGTSVLLKAGHLDADELSDILYLNDLKEFNRFSSARIHTKNTHGTGCTLSSAIAAQLALGFDLLDAVSRAKAYLLDALLRGAEYEVGTGHGPLKHF